MNRDVSLPIVLKGAKAICGAVNENPKQIASLVKQEGLPAWRRSQNDSWRARPEALKTWAVEQQQKYLKSV